MTHREFIIQTLPIVMQFDRRLQVHSFFEVDGIWKHSNKCQRCSALQILGHEQEMEFSV